MRKITLLLISLFWLPSWAMAGDGYQGNLVQAAKRLDRAAQRLHRLGHQELGYSRMTRELRAFSRQASLLCELVVYGARDRDISRQYNRLLRRFDSLSYQLGYHRNGRYVYLEHRLAKAGKALRRFDRAFYFDGHHPRRHGSNRYGYERQPRYRSPRGQHSFGFKSQ